MKLNVYLETTFPSLPTVWPGRSVLVAGWQQTARDGENQGCQRGGANLPPSRRLLPRLGP